MPRPDDLSGVSPERDDVLAPQAVHLRELAGRRKASTRRARAAARRRWPFTCARHVRDQLCRSRPLRAAMWCFALPLTLVKYAADVDPARRLHDRPDPLVRLRSPGDCVSVRQRKTRVAHRRHEANCNERCLKRAPHLQSRLLLVVAAKTGSLSMNGSNVTTGHRSTAIRRSEYAGYPSSPSSWRQGDGGGSSLST